jgi:hypothetical protein
LIPEEKIRRPAYLTPQDSHLDPGVEEHEIDRDFEGSQGLVVLGVEEPGVLHGDVAHLASGLDPRRAEIDCASPLELREPREGLGGGA